MADMALTFIADVPVLQTWLDEPLISSGPIADCTKPGDILVNIGVMAHYQPSSPASWPGNEVGSGPNFFMFRKITNVGGGDGWDPGTAGEGIIQHFSDPMAALIGGLFSLLESRISGNVADNALGTGLTLFTHDNPNIPFTISLVDKNPLTGSAEFGIRFWFDEVVVKKDLLKLFFQKEIDLDEWTAGENFIPGFTIIKVSGW